MNNKERAAMQQALEAIGDCSPNKTLVNAAYALREALAEQALQKLSDFHQSIENEPVAWLYDWEHEGEIVTGWVTQDFETTKFNNGHNVRPLYAAPRPVSQEQEILASNCPKCGRKVVGKLGKGVVWCCPVCIIEWPVEELTQQPVKEVELTDDEISDAIHGKGSPLRLNDYAIRDFRAVIAAHKEKNRG